MVKTARQMKNEEPKINTITRKPEKYFASLVDTWCDIKIVGDVRHDFSFLTNTITIPVLQSGERRLSLWMAYLAYTHQDIITITPLAS